MALVETIGARARAAGQSLAATTLLDRNAALTAVRAALLANVPAIVAANERDMAAAAATSLDAAVVKVGRSVPDGAPRARAQSVQVRNTEPVLASHPACSASC